MRLADNFLLLLGVLLALEENLSLRLRRLDFSAQLLLRFGGEVRQNRKLALRINYYVLKGLVHL